jgi:hypothetical protein
VHARKMGEATVRQEERAKGVEMNRLIYLIGLIVVILFIAGFLGIR